MLLPLGVIFTPCTARNMQLSSPAGAEKCGTFAAVVTSATQETSKGYLLSHSQLWVRNVNLNWGVCEGQEEDAAQGDAGREGKALDGTHGMKMHATNFVPGPNLCTC